MVEGGDGTSEGGAGEATVGQGKAVANGPAPSERTDIGPLLAKEAIREALYDALDAWRRRDWGRLRASFTPDARIDLGLRMVAQDDPDRTSPRGFDVEREVAALADAMRGYVASSLVASNCQIELGFGAMAARSSTLILAAHESPPESGERIRLEALRLNDRWIRDRAGEWKVAQRTTESLWRAWIDPRRDDRAGDHRHALEWER